MVTKIYKDRETHDEADHECVALHVTVDDRPARIEPGRTGDVGQHDRNHDRRRRSRQELEQLPNFEEL